MSALQGSNDLAFIRAQITKDDKELREIIKEQTQAAATTKKPSTRSTTTKSRGKSTGWASAEPQRAVLMDVESGLYPDFRTPPRTPSPSSQTLYRPTWKSRPSARA
ncbi:DNA-directed DNA-polymerase family A mitochondria [Penicillium chermesinum]|nr:DNA-directed DNA-polymerase family A mitochondria [Penicillium chermesinum]